MGGSEGPDFNKNSYRTHSDRALAQSKNRESSSSITGRKGRILSRSWFLSAIYCNRVVGGEKQKADKSRVLLKGISGRELYCRRSSKLKLWHKALYFQCQECSGLQFLCQPSTTTVLQQLKVLSLHFKSVYIIRWFMSR